ncbi:MAG: hypothetical protein MUF21_00020 [Gemmatimonadaceae bacterium]|jgi:hypothetical protein|nr:hypothetical protein [Gemmatimonadaceae bacterium]
MSTTPSLPPAPSKAITVDALTGAYLLRALLDSDLARGRSPNPRVARWAADLRETLREVLPEETVRLVDQQVEELAGAVVQSV